MAVSNSSCGSADVEHNKALRTVLDQAGGAVRSALPNRDAAATSDPKTQELKKLTSDRSLHGGVIASESVRGGGEDGREGP